MLQQPHVNIVGPQSSEIYLYNVNFNQFTIPYSKRSIKPVGITYLQTKPAKQNQ